jgi:hypothetical protein
MPIETHVQGEPADVSAATTSTTDSHSIVIPVPQAGAVTDAVHAAFTMLCESVVEVVAALTSAGDALSDTAKTYVTTDENQTFGH